MTPYETVLTRYRLPSFIEEHPLQVACINALAELDREGYWLEMGTGKTMTSTVVSLYKLMRSGRRTVVVMPPLLITQWARWLRSIIDTTTGKPLRVTEYRGTPAQRKAKDLGADFILVGAQIFKKEYDRFVDAFAGEAYRLVVDEATMVGNIGSQTHEKLYDFGIGQDVALLTGTPGDPEVAYGLIKFTAPGAYRNLKQYENLHVDERDFWGAPAKWKNLDVLAEKLMINSQRILYADMYKGSEVPLFDPLPYDLEPEHLKLYKKLAEEELLKLPDGGKLDATAANKLTHNLGQIVANWGHFSGDPRNVSNAYRLIEQKLAEIGTQKLVVFANYRLTVSQIVNQFSGVGAVAINGDVTPKQKDLAVERFRGDPACRLIVVQFRSGGFGLDGLQHVSHHCLFIEPCQKPSVFHQCVARLRRTGQKHRVWVGLCIANKTNQPKAFLNLLANDEIANQVIRNEIELRAAIFGEDEIDWGDIKRQLGSYKVDLAEVA